MPRFELADAALVAALLDRDGPQHEKPHRRLGEPCPYWVFYGRLLRPCPWCRAQLARTSG